jgi:hypothetical protein
MKTIYVCIVLALITGTVTNGQYALIGDHGNATYFAKQYTDIQGFISSALMDGYQTIRIAQGIYYVSRSTLITASNVTLTGSFDTDNNVSTTIHLNNTKMIGLAMFAVIDAENVSIENMIINGLNIATKTMYELNGVSFTNTTVGSMKNVIISNFRNGVFVNVSTMLTFQEMYVHSSQHDGLQSRMSNNITIANSSVSSNGRHGVNFYGNNTSITLSQNNVTSQNADGSCGMRVENSNIVYVIDNNFIQNNIGVCLKSVTDAQLLNNTISGLKNMKCVYLVGVFPTTFVNNECNDKFIDPTTASPQVVQSPPSSRQTSQPPSPPKKRKSSTVCNIVSHTVMLSMVMVSSLLM